MAPPKRGHFVLHSIVKPPMTAGRYQLVSDQTNLPFDVAEERTHVHVSSPRYVMPPEQILSSFPPANGEGAFGDRLPQIVLKRRTLPWERNPAGGTEVSTTPWLALVVVAEGEGELSTPAPVAQCVTPGETLPDPADKDVEQGVYLAVTDTVVKKIFPCEKDLPLLVHVREVDVTDTELANGDDDGWLAVVLANRLPVFDTGAGRAVRYLACLVNVEGQLDALPPPVPPVDHFRFEVAQDWLAVADEYAQADHWVMGGMDVGKSILQHPGPQAQFGAAKQAKAAIGPSLDGATTIKPVPTAKEWAGPTSMIAAAAADPDAARMVRDTMGIGFRVPISVLAIEKVWRFPVLAHWSFTTTEGATFETLMQDLDVGLLGTVPEQPAGAPPVPDRPAVVETGHIDLGHRSRRGDPVRAWYRGPLVPFPTTRDQAVQGKLPVAHSADQLRRVVPDGREDLSLASGFEIGRLLALSQLSVVSALLRFRREQFGAGRVHQILDVFTPFAVPGLVDERIDLGRFVAVTVLEDLAVNPVKTLGPRRPVADPGRAVELRGQLDEVVATGLGFDLQAVRKAAGTIGVVAAVAGTTVPMATIEGPDLDGAALAGLQTALRTEVLRVAGIATPGRPGVPRAEAPEPDALDELIRTADDSGEL